MWHERFPVQKLANNAASLGQIVATQEPYFAESATMWVEWRLHRNAAVRGVNKYNKAGVALRGTTPIPVQSLRVLVVEDCPDGAEMLAAHLKKWGYSYRLCASGTEAIDVAVRFEPDVVLIDIGLPDMEGWQLARQLPGAVIKIAITGRGEESDFERSEQAGISYHLVKPAYQRQLHQLLQRVASGSR